MTKKHDKQEMDVYSGVRWSAASKYGAEAVHFAVSITLARLLAPEHFGLLGMAVVITGFAKKFHNLGFAKAIVQRKELSDDLLSTLFWVNLGLCVLVTGAVAGLSPAAGWMYADPRVVPIVAVLSLNFVLAGLSMIPTAILQRRMAFKKLAVREIGAIVANGGTSITLALLGYGVWALVWGMLAGSAARVLLINLVCPFVPRLVWEREGLKESLGFGLNLTGFGIFNALARKSDNLIIGIFLGATPLGYYSLAYRLMLLPRNAVSQIVTRVLFPKLSRLQDDDEKLADLYLRAVGAIAFVTFPMMAGLAVLAEPFVQVVLGEKWLPAVPLIWVLAPVGGLQSLWMMTGQTLLAKGRADWYLRQGVIRGVFLVLGFLVGVPFGVIGVAISYGVLCLAWTPIAFWMAAYHVRSLKFRTIVVSLIPYGVLAGTLASAVGVSRYAFGWGSLPVLINAPISAALGILCFAICLFLIRPPALNDYRQLLPATLWAPLHRLALRSAR